MYNGRVIIRDWRIQTDKFVTIRALSSTKRLLPRRFRSEYALERTVPVLLSFG